MLKSLYVMTLIISLTYCNMALPQSLMKSPDKPEVYFIYNNEKRLIPDQATFDRLSLNKSLIKVVDAADLEQLKEIQAIISLQGVGENDLFKAIGKPEVYLVKSGQRFLIPNAATFNHLGFEWGKIREIPESELLKTPEGLNLPHMHTFRTLTLRSFSLPSVAVDALSGILEGELRGAIAEFSPITGEETKKHVKWAIVRPGDAIGIKLPEIKTIVAEYTEEIKWSVEFGAPNLNFTSMEIKIDRVNKRWNITAPFIAQTKSKGKASYKIPRLVATDIKGSGDCTFSGILKVSIERKQDSATTKFEILQLNGKLTDLSFNNDAVNLFRGDIQADVNLGLNIRKTVVQKKLNRQLAQKAHNVKIPDWVTVLVSFYPIQD